MQYREEPDLSGGGRCLGYRAKENGGVLLKRAGRVLLGDRGVPWQAEIYLAYPAVNIWARQSDPCI